MLNTERYSLSPYSPNKLNNNNNNSNNYTTTIQQQQQYDRQRESELRQLIDMIPFGSSSSGSMCFKVLSSSES
jgi:hypothetical protein